MLAGLSSSMTDGKRPWTAFKGEMKGDVKNLEDKMTDGFRTTSEKERLR